MPPVFSQIGFLVHRLSFVVPPGTPDRHQLLASHIIPEPLPHSHALLF
jgi:hypothetical protein